MRTAAAGKFESFLLLTNYAIDLETKVNELRQTIEEIKLSHERDIMDANAMITAMQRRESALNRRYDLIIAELKSTIDIMKAKCEVISEG